MILDKEIVKKIEAIDLTKPAPAEEPTRQYYFLKKAKEIIREESGKLGRPLTACTTTFGCQMNTVPTY